MRVLLTELKRAVLSYGFLAAVAGSVIVVFLSGSAFLEQMQVSGNSMGEAFFQISYNAVNSELFLLVIPILCTLPFSASFMEELQSRFLREYLPRAGRRNYLVSKLTATAVSGGLALFLGLTIVLAGYAILFPPIGLEQADIVGEYAFNAQTYYISVLFVSLAGCLWSAVGGFAAAATRNRYMAYACPFILYYVLSVFQERYFTDYYIFSPREWIYPEHIGVGSIWPPLICAFIALAAVCAAYYILMKRRLHDV